MIALPDQATVGPRHGPPGPRRVNMYLSGDGKLIFLNPEPKIEQLQFVTAYPETENASS